MKSSAKKVELASVDDLFSTEESRADAQREKVLEIPLSELHPFKDHPFKVKDDEAMMETADSIRQYGVLVPAIARPDPNGGYELVAGHRRHRASELAGKDTMPVIVRDLDDDQATIIMVDSNLQRESLLPSERAFAYKMKLEAMKHQGARGDLRASLKDLNQTWRPLPHIRTRRMALPEWMCGAMCWRIRKTPGLLCWMPARKSKAPTRRRSGAIGALPYRWNL